MQRIFSGGYRSNEAEIINASMEEQYLPKFSPLLDI